MNVFLLTAHPEPRSLNGSLSRFIVDHLKSQGHQVQVSDLYAMRWKTSLDRDDFQPADALEPMAASNPPPHQAAPCSTARSPMTSRPSRPSCCGPMP